MEPINGTAVHSLAESPVPLPVAAGQIITFTPKCAEALNPAPVFRLEVPSVSTRAGYQRDQITRCGGEYPDDAFVRWSFRRALKQCFDDGAELLAQLSDLESALKDAATADDATEAAQQIREIEVMAVRRDARYAELVAARRYHLAMMPLIVLQHFLVGWENVDGPAFKRMRGLTAESSIEQIPEDQRRELASRAMQLLGTTGATAKNSAPRS